MDRIGGRGGNALVGVFWCCVIYAVIGGGWWLWVVLTK